MQYTIRKIPPHIDRELRRRADQEHKSLNEVTLQALEKGLDLTDQALRHSDLDDLIGTWVEDPEFDRAVEEMDQVDPELWA
ncbi:MAG: antitoxin [Candidatus Latescibacteria bacterium]|nr:antitoxin [Candidatus Latescibacterota bacterium]